MKSDGFLEVARIGKRVGLKGGLKLHPSNDFPEIFTPNTLLKTEEGFLKVERYDSKKNLIFFEGFDTPELSEKLINKTLFMSEDETREKCLLDKDEFFWFDIQGCSVVEKEVLLGRVKEIQRLSKNDFLLVETSDKLVQEGFAKEFLVPYVSRYVGDVDLEQKTIYTDGAYELLESL